MSFISYLINGISLGSVYAIIALGYTMVYGIAKMLNFAHGDVIMIGAYMALITMMKAGMSPILAIVAAVIVCTVLGILIERIAYKPLRNASSSLAVLITAIGVSYLLQNTALLVFGANAQTFPRLLSGKVLSFGRRQAEHFRGDDRDDRGMCSDHDRTDAVRAEIKAGSGNARCIGR